MLHYVNFTFALLDFTVLSKFAQYSDRMEIHFTRISVLRGISSRRNHYIKNINSNHSSKDVLQLMSRFRLRVILEKVGFLVFLVQKQHEVNVFFVVLVCSMHCPCFETGTHTIKKYFNMVSGTILLRRNSIVFMMLICEISILP